MKNNNKNLSLELLRNYPFVPSLIILAILIILNGIFEPNSISLSSLTGLISTYLALMLLAVAQTYVVMSSDIDLSVGGIISLVERKRFKGELDGFRWYCDECHQKLYEEFLPLTDIVKQLPPIFDGFWANDNARSCESCSAYLEKP